MPFAIVAGSFVFKAHHTCSFGDGRGDQKTGLLFRNLSQVAVIWVYNGK